MVLSISKYLRCLFMVWFSIPIFTWKNHSCCINPASCELAHKNGWHDHIWNLHRTLFNKAYSVLTVISSSRALKSFKWNKDVAIMTVNVMRLNVVGSQGKWPYIRKDVVTQILIMKTKDITSTFLLHCFGKARPQQDMLCNMNSVFLSVLYIL